MLDTRLWTVLAVSAALMTLAVIAWSRLPLPEHVVRQTCVRCGAEARHESRLGLWLEPSVGTTTASHWASRHLTAGEHVWYPLAAHDVDWQGRQSGGFSGPTPPPEVFHSLREHAGDEIAAHLLRESGLVLERDPDAWARLHGADLAEWRGYAHPYPPPPRAGGPCGTIPPSDGGPS
ncbi:MAG: hypothetical protein AAF533_23260 [Acidobacteriota bacterium]